MSRRETVNCYWCGRPVFGNSGIEENGRRFCRIKCYWAWDENRRANELADRDAKIGKVLKWMIIGGIILLLFKSGCFK